MTLPLIKATPTHVKVKGQCVTQVTKVDKNGEETSDSKKEGFPYNIEFRQVSNQYVHVNAMSVVCKYVYSNHNGIL